MSTSEEKAKSIGKIAGFATGIVGAFILANLFSIEPQKVYGWFAGLWHGVWAIPNYLMSLFIDRPYFVKAPLHTSAYIVCWWIFLIWSVLFYLNFIFRIIGIIRRF